MTNMLEKYQAMQETEQTMKLVIRMVEFDEALNSDILTLDVAEARVIVPRDELSIRRIETSLVKHIGKKIEVAVKEIQEDGTVICSHKMVQEAKRDELVERLTDGEVVKATITRFVNFGAYLNASGVSMLLLNRDFSTDHTAVREVHKVKDEVEVKLVRVSESGNINVEMVEKYQTGEVASIEMFKPNQVVLGEVRTIKPDSAFVCIAPGLDALCPVPEEEIEVGSKVRFKISQVRVEERRVRGKILDTVSEEAEDEFL